MKANPDKESGTHWLLFRLSEQGKPPEGLDRGKSLPAKISRQVLRRIAPPLLAEHGGVEDKTGVKWCHPLSASLYF